MSRLKYLVVVLLLLFGAYGFFFPEWPVVNADELWETSRAYHLLTHHKPGEPIIPKEVSPFYASVENLPWQGWFLGTAKLGSFAFMMLMMPGKEWIAMRLAMFIWTVVLLLLTYKLARRLKLSGTTSLYAITLLAFLPDFFIQVHRERAEIIIAVSLVALVSWMLKAMEEERMERRRIHYLWIGLFSWLPSFFVHPSAIIIPPVLGLLFLIRERKKLIGSHTLFMGIGLIAGAVFFLYLMNSVKMYAELAGGGNYFKYQGPPVLVRGWKYVIAIPAAFYFKFTVFNALSRPVSFVIFLIGFTCIYAAGKKFPDWLSGNRYSLVIVSVFISLLLLYLLSGSFGHYNIVVAPFIVIVIAGFLERMEKERKNLASITALVLVVVSVITSAWTLPESKDSAVKYKNLLSQVDRAIPKQNEGVMGLGLYYPPFKDERFYSVSWFNRDAGIEGQSFDEAVAALKVQYIVVDDALIGRSMLDRGKGWTDSLITFLSTQCDTVTQLRTDLRAGNRVPSRRLYPEQWLYPEFKSGCIRKVVIFHVRGRAS